MSSQKRTTYIDGNLYVNGNLTISEGLLYMTGNVSGTNVSGDQTWAAAAAPVLTTGIYYFTFTNGTSTFRVPCWPTT